MTHPGDDDPVTLQEACELAFRGTITVASLRAEASRGNLDIFRVGRRDFTTLRAVREMQAKCLAGRKGRTYTVTPAASNGLSEMDHVSSALAALRTSTKKLRSSSQSTSVENTNPRQAQRR
jgi:hypothetical protein